MNSFIVKFFAVFAITVVFSSSELTAQQYPITHYTKDRDLPGNQVWAILQDHKGYMWFATSYGLVKYNGKEYTLLGKKDGLMLDTPFDLTEDTKGRLWIGFDRGVGRIMNGQVHNWILKETEDRFGVYSDSYGRMWAFSTTFNADVYYFLNDSLHNFSTEHEFKNQAVLNMFEDQEGSVFFLTRTGNLYRFFAGAISHVQIRGLAVGTARYAFFDSNNNLIVCTADGAGIVYSEKLYTDPTLHWMINFPVNYGLESRRGRYWFSSRRYGLFRVSSRRGDHSVVRLTDRNGLLSNNVYRIYEDCESNLWIGYDGKGVSKLSSMAFRKYGREEGFTADAILSMIPMPDGILCATEKGLLRFKNNAFEQVVPQSRSPHNIFLCLLPWKKGSILLGLAPGLYRLSENLEIEYIGLRNRVVRSMTKDHTGKVWIGTHEGLFILQGENVIVEQDLGLWDRSIGKIYEVENRHLYVGTDKGLFIIKNGTMPYARSELIRPPQLDLLSESVNDITVDNKGNILVATRRGLAIIAGDPSNTANIPDLDDHDVVALHVDAKGTLWAGTTSGLFVLQNIDTTYRVATRYSHREGLASNEFTLNGTIYEDLEGRIYFGSFNGLSIYDPSEEPSIAVSPRCHIIGIQANELIFPTSGNSALELSQSRSKISFLVEALSFFNEDALSLEYYLAPLEKEWASGLVPATSAITYGYLEPNDYVFYVRSVNQFGISSDIQSVSFTVLAPVWKRPWFIATAIIVFVFVGYQLNQYRQSHIRRRNAMLEQIVKDRTRELEERKAELEKSKVHIEEQYHRLIEAQKELVEKKQLQKAYKEIQQLRDKLARENIYLREKHGSVHELSSIIGKSELITEIRRKIVEIAATDSTVLITGETGVGKNLVAEAIHNLSARKKRALITVNCAAIPESLVESELFGHEKGAFTGASERRIGKFEVADGSTIFLDEIGDMNLAVQAKVLNVLQSRVLTRVGGNSEVNVDVRIIAATNHNLSELLDQGKFRQDLFYRVSVFTIHIPPLRERPEDIIILAKYLIDHYSKVLKKPITEITKSALNVLCEYSYPGNIRELENIINRAIIICKGNVISDKDILIQQETSWKGTAESDDNNEHSVMLLENVERQHILRVLQETNWKIAGGGGAAERLGLHPSTVRFRMKKLGIPLPSTKKLG